ncbi:MAG: hypothetical protein ACYS17_02195 [Planctomycetota bacterium]|jgi:hypothetical protein
MWEEEKDFETLGEVEAYDMNDESTGDFMYAELDPSVDENENSDVFDYEADFYNDEEDE